ncbi:hypothetical protein ACHHYP_07688 [Achlya hypogyna]|uniref:Uncharacterized protein n=1 Tax=Achlya hypogyna TaxID=1202772 RepID=A0A1V9YQM4_ACHHY|nr:hypothetical protein ACHHYP_07688 [Achlya hypogyna]
MGKKKVVANDIRATIYADVLHGMKFSKSPYGLFKQVAEKYGLASKTIRRIWQRGQESDGDVAHRVRGNKGRGRSEAQLQAINAKLNDIPHIEEKDLRTIAKAVDLPLSSLHKYMSTGVVKPKGHTTTRPKRHVVSVPDIELVEELVHEELQPPPAPSPVMTFDADDLDDRLQPIIHTQPLFHASASDSRQLESLQEENERLRRDNHELMRSQRALVALQVENERLTARNTQLAHALRDLSARLHLEAL